MLKDFVSSAQKKQKNEFLRNRKFCEIKKWFITMLRDLIAWVLNNYLGRYVENLNTTQLTVALLSGKQNSEKSPKKDPAMSHRSQFIAIYSYFSLIRPLQHRNSLQRGQQHSKFAFKWRFKPIKFHFSQNFF